MDNQQLYYTYVSFDGKGKYYIGYSKNDIESGYKGSFRDKTFKPIKRLDLNVSEIKEIAMLMEYSYQSAWNTTHNKDFANKSLCNINSDVGFSSYACSDELRNHRAKTQKEKWLNPEYRAYMETINIGKKHSDETKAKMSANSAMKHKPEARAKISKALAGKPKPKSQIAKIKLKKKINNMLKHIMGLKQFKSYAKMSDKDIINEVQRLEREFVGLKT